MTAITLQDFLTIDLPALLAASLACVACSLVGGFLVLRRQALMGDAVSHVVLPGIVAAFAISGAIESLTMMAGALVSALVAVVLIELVRRLGRLEPGAAMGTVFTVMFAVGVGMLEWTGSSGVHLDTQHALFGSLEAILWIGPGDSLASLTDPAVLAAVPRQVTTLFVVTVVLAVLLIVFYKELKITTFDPGLAATLGISPRWVGIGLVLATGVAAVAAFEAVGSILVIAMFISPPCTARMLTDRLSTQIWVTVAVALASGVLGYLLAAFGPGLFGRPDALNAAGMVAVVAGAFQIAAMLFAPRHGVLMRTRSAVMPRRATE